MSEKRIRSHVMQGSELSEMFDTGLGAIIVADDYGVTARNGIYSTLRDRETSKINHLNSIVSSRFRTFIRCSHRTVTY